MTSQNIVIPQRKAPGLLIRGLYFLLFGLWFSGVWAAVAWVLCVTIIGLPFGLWMLNRLPQVSTLQAQRQDLVITSAGKVYTADMRQHPFLLRAVYFVLIGWVSTRSTPTRWSAAPLCCRTAPESRSACS